MDNFEIEYAERYPGIVKLWLNAWERFIPFLAYPPVIAKIVYTTDLVVILSRPGGVWDVAEKGIQDPGALPRRRLQGTGHGAAALSSNSCADLVICPLGIHRWGSGM